MGVTHKTDGKSSENFENETISHKFTQGSNEQDHYSENDKTGTYEYKGDKQPIKFYMTFGFMSVILGFLIYSLSLNQSQLDYERDRVLREQADAANEHYWETERQNQDVLRHSTDRLNENPLRSA